MRGGDPVCLHRAAYWYVQGGLEREPEPEPPAPILPIDCAQCRGCGVLNDRELERAGVLYPPCVACAGTGEIVAPVLVAADAITAAATA